MYLYLIGFQLSLGPVVWVYIHNNNINRFTMQIYCLIKVLVYQYYAIGHVVLL